MARVLALTGGIGSGKSTVAGLFEKLGAVVIDADAITHELQARGSPLLDEIAAAFGAELIDDAGELDREALAGLVFRDAEARARLNALVHPRVGTEMARRVAEAVEAGAALVILDVPVLYEAREQRARAAAEAPARPESAGAGGGLDALPVIVVHAPESAQIERQLARDGYDRAEAERRVRAQIPIDEKRRRADFVIDNGGSRAETERQVRALYERLVEAA